MLEAEDLKRISIELIRLNSDRYHYLDIVNLIFNAIEEECRGSETCSSDIYEEVIKSIIYERKENE